MSLVKNLLNGSFRSFMVLCKNWKAVAQHVCKSKSGERSLEPEDILFQ